ncbi:MAG TPA: alginate export family protein [Candidatus Acidoferrales bacterium]|nr:alginate export family protein [Candidatus Acidoferrales bacterium]
MTLSRMQKGACYTTRTATTVWMLASMLFFLHALCGVAFADSSSDDSGDKAAPKAQSTKPKQPPDFESVPDRWHIAPPPYERNVPGHWWDPYNQNILKGDYPIFGDDIFLRLTGFSKTLLEGRAIPSPSGVSSNNPGSNQFFGQNDSMLFDQKFGARIELQRGSTSFRPFEWQIVLTGVVDVNRLDVHENGLVSPDVRDGTSRTTNDAALQEAFVEIHLADLSANYDFLSTKLGRQPFNSDFRSLIFSDTNQGARLFGNANGNRYQYNLVYFHMAEKDTNSELNTFDLRNQQVAIANLYVQDFLLLGYTQQLSVHYDHDEGRAGGYVYDRQGFLVRPDPVGTAQPHNIDVVYLGWTSEGHIGFLNVSHAFYQALGRDGLNPIAGRAVDINAQLAFLELSMDRDWMRYQVSAFFTSGDSNPRDGTARGFDSILDAPKIVGGEVSYWNHQSIPITDRGGINLMQRDSVIPDLRSSKIQGQANFVNPGILILNAGASAQLTPKVKVLANANYLRFNEVAPLELLLKQPNIREDIGVDCGVGLEYRPLLNNNIVLKTFAGFLQPVGGLRDIYEGSTLYHAGGAAQLVF